MEADRSQTLADWTIFLAGKDDEDIKMCPEFSMPIDLQLNVSLDVSEDGGLRLFESWALIASWYLRYLSCEFDQLINLEQNAN